MNKNEKIGVLDDAPMDKKYDLVKLSDTCEEIFEIDGIDLPKEYEEKMPLLRDLYPPKKKEHLKGDNYVT